MHVCCPKLHSRSLLPPPHPDPSPTYPFPVTHLLAFHFLPPEGHLPFVGWCSFILKRRYFPSVPSSFLSLLIPASLQRPTQATDFFSTFLTYQQSRLTFAMFFHSTASPNVMITHRTPSCCQKTPNNFPFPKIFKLQTRGPITPVHSRLFTT